MSERAGKKKIWEETGRDGKRKKGNRKDFNSGIFNVKTPR